MKKPLKTFLFIMNHGRMRLGLVKRIRKEREVYLRLESLFRGWDKKPNFHDPILRGRLTAMIELYPKQSDSWCRWVHRDYLYGIGEDAGGEKTVWESFPKLPPPPPKRKFTDNEIGGKEPNTTFNEAMKEVSDRIEYKMAMQNFAEIAKEYFTGTRSDNPLP